MRKQHEKPNYNTDGQKQCTKCKEYKNLSDFHRYSKSPDGYKHFCKVCVKDYDLSEHDVKRVFPRKHKDNLQHCRKCNEYLDKKEFWSNNTYCKSCTVLIGHVGNLKKYNMTKDDYVDLELKQNGVCAICKKPETNRKRLSIDHDHSCCSSESSCGKCVRGLLCSKCNRGIGSFEDNLDLLQNAINYLKK